MFGVRSFGLSRDSVQGAPPPERAVGYNLDRSAFVYTSTVMIGRFTGSDAGSLAIVSGKPSIASGLI